MADLPSILGGMAQGFLDFGKSAVDFFGTGGASIADLIESARTGKATTKNQDDFRKWLYQTDSTKDAAAKGLGTALNGVQTVADYIPGVNVLTRNPLGNAAQGALGGLADEFKTYGENYDLGRAGQRAAVSAAAAAASGSLADALKGSSNALLSSNTLQGVARGATGGAISGGGYAAIDGGDVLEAAKQGAGMGALIGGATGLAQDFMPRKATYDMALTDDEKAARIAKTRTMLANEQDPERIAELNNQIKNLGGPLETTLASDDMTVNSPRYLTDENGNPRTFYHGSPNKNITEFDINKAGKNTRSGERALYFTDSPEVADEFSYERIPTDDLFLENRGEKGRVYPVNLEMNNPLDLDNLTDAQIRELWDYASPMGQLDGQEKFIKNLTNWRDNTHNAQLTKGYLDLDKLRNSQYDGFTARMYPNQDNQAREYAVFDNSKVKMLEDVLANDDMAVNNPKLTPEQEAYFKDSVIRDENGNLMPLYHGSNSKFTVFDSSKGGQSNKVAKVGHWFTPSKEGAEKWAGQAWWGDNDPTVYETYLNIKKPMVYEAIDNSAQIKKLETQLKQVEDRLNSTYRGSQEYYDAYKEYNNIADEIDNLSYTDPYEQFRSHIYAMEGKTPSQANVGGVGMAMNDEDAAVQKYVDMLKSEGYDGIIIKGTGYDQNVMGGPNDQYVVFDSNQIKDINNLRPTSDVDIMAEIIPEDMDLGRTLSRQDLSVNSAKIAPGQLGLFDDMPTQTPKTGTRQTSLFDQPNNPYLDYYGADIDATPLAPETPANPYAPVNGEVTQAMRDRAADILGNWKKNGVPENELYNAINQDTLPDKVKSLKEIVDGGAYDKRMKELFGTTDIKKADIGKVIDYLYESEPARADNIKNNLLAERGLGKYEQRFRNRMKKSLYEAAQERIANDIGANGLASSKNIADVSIRQGYTAAADEALSERLGIAPGNTPKYNGAMDTRNAFGRYSHPSYREGGDLAVFERKMSSPEDAISTVAHERLHSFQGELEPRSKGRYDKEVLEAYEQLRRDLAPHYKSWDETAERYGHRGTGYWQSGDEQESRMLQNYLENKGYTDSTHMKSKYRAGEWGNEINPAFDKFFDKLRDLSKRGVALPALAALFGGGAYMASQENDKEKEVK